MIFSFVKVFLILLSAVYELEKYFVLHMIELAINKSLCEWAEAWGVETRRIKQLDPHCPPWLIDSFLGMFYLLLHHFKNFVQRVSPISANGEARFTSSQSWHAVTRRLLIGSLWAELPHWLWQICCADLGVERLRGSHHIAVTDQVE